MARSSWLTALACAAVAVNAARCPKFEDVAALSGPVGRFDLNKYVGGASDYWYEVASHNLPVLTTGCQCTRYNNSRINDVDWTDAFECRKKSPSAKPTTFTSVGHASSSPNATLGGAMMRGTARRGLSGTMTMCGAIVCMCRGARSECRSTWRR